MKDKLSEPISRRAALATLGAAGLAAASIFIPPAIAQGKGETVKSGNVSLPDNRINVKNYGAVGDGKKDDTNAFIKAIAQAESLSVKNPGQGSNNRGRATIYIPPGAYKITKAEALMRGSYRARTLGLHIEGAGSGITQILFRPSQAGGYLLKNIDAWLHLVISDIEFDSNHPANNFMYSLSHGGAQNYLFERCLWNGSWNNVFRLEGSNNNSECTWYHCGFRGSYKSVVIVPPTASTDQFLNYNFIATNFEAAKGDFLEFNKGGNINVWGGSFIHYGKGGGTFFKLYGTSHAQGVQRFLCTGARMEMKDNHSYLVDCTWDEGNVHFLNVDTSSSYNFNPPQKITAKFKSTNEKMPTIKFDSCNLSGAHQYSYLSNSHRKPHNVVYDSCQISNHNEPHSFIAYDESRNSSNIGGRPVIKFRNCRGLTSSVEQIWESDLNYHLNMAGTSTKKIISLKTPWGSLPYAAIPELSVTLPMNAIITGIIIYSPSGAVTHNSSAAFTVSTTETVPTVLAAVSPANYSLGMSSNNSLFFICDSKAKCTLKFTAENVTQSNDKGFCLIEYIG